MGFAWTAQLESEIKKYNKNMERFESRFEELDTLRVKSYALRMK